MKYSLIALVGCILSFVALAQKIPSDLIRQKYENSPTTPDSLAFREFVGQVTDYSSASGVEAALDFLVDIVAGGHLPHTDAGHVMHSDADYALAVEFLALLSTASEKMQSDERDGERNIVCPQDRASRSANQHLQAMDDLDDLQEEIAEQQLLSVMNQLDRDRQAALMSHLQEVKKSFVYVKLNHRKLYEDNGLDAVTVVNDWCYKISSSKE